MKIYPKMGIFLLGNCFLLSLFWVGGCGNLQDFECKQNRDCSPPAWCYLGQCKASFPNENGEGQKDGAGQETPTTEPQVESPDSTICRAGEKKCDGRKKALSCAVSRKEWQTTVCKSDEECQNGTCQKNVSPPSCRVYWGKDHTLCVEGNFGDVKPSHLKVWWCGGGQQVTSTPVPFLSTTGGYCTQIPIPTGCQVSFQTNRTGVYAIHCSQEEKTKYGCPGGFWLFLPKTYACSLDAVSYHQGKNNEFVTN
jgi:hypothetical protein